jgi:hypothetical protein
MRSVASQFCRTVRLGAACCLVLLLAGCAGSTEGGHSPSLLSKMLAITPEEKETPPPAAEPQGCGSPAQCKSALKKMVESPKRGWVGQHQPAGHYVDGTRLFAYRALRTKLSCRELSAAMGEVRAASKSLAGDVAGVSREQASRTRTLSQQVEAELVKERSARCSA